MTNPLPSDRWERVAAELRAYREAQKQAWGDIDNATLGRYLADEVTGEERRQIEQAVNERPELGLLLGLVRDVLTEFEPVPVPAPVPPTPPTPVPPVFSFPSRAGKRPVTSRWPGSASRQRGVLLAAACLLLGLGLSVSETGNGEGNLPLSGLLVQQAEARRLILGQAEPVRLPPTMQLDQMEREIRALETEGRARDAFVLRQQLPQLARQAGKGKDYLAANYTCMAQLCQAQGNLAEAESHYRKACELFQSQLGAPHPHAHQAVIGLARTYQTALNPPRPEGRPAFALTSALAGTLIRKHPGELRRSVVPALVSGLRQSATVAERRAFLQALARLGPAARDAIPALVDVLQKSPDSGERQAVVQVLGQMGPTAEGALPVLIEATACSCPEVSQAAALALLQHGPRGWVALHSLKDRGDGRQKQLARMVLQKSSPRLSCAGIKDSCELFTVVAILQAQDDLQTLARTHGVPVYVETVDESATQDAKERDADAWKVVSTQTVYLRFHKEPARMEIHVPPALQQERLPPARQQELQTRIAGYLSARDYDAALRQAALFFREK